MTPELETGDMLVITVAVPTQSAVELEITAHVPGPRQSRRVPVRELC